MEKMKHKKTYNTLQNIGYLIPQVWQDSKILFLYYGIYTILSALSPFYMIFIPKFIIDELMGAKRFEVLVCYVMFLFVVTSLTGFLTSYFGNAYRPCVIKVRMNFVKKHQEKCLTTELKNTENPHFLDDMNTAFGFINTLSGGLEGVLNSLFSFGGIIIAFFGYITIVFMLNPIILIYLILSVSCTYYLSNRVKKYEYSKKDELSKLSRISAYTGNIMQDFSYAKDIRMFNISDFIINMFVSTKNQLLQINRKIKSKYLQNAMINVLLFMLRDGVAYGFLIYRVVVKNMSIGDFTLYFAAIMGFSGWMHSVVNNITNLKAQNLRLNDLRAFLDSPDELSNSENIELPNAPLEIEFRNVSFKYPGSEKYIFKNFNFKIRNGEKLAIVGQNGAGKTSFIKLLCRLYDPDEGQILLNNIDIKRFPKENYYSLFSVVFQDFKILAFSIAENIALQNKDKVDIVKVEKCIELSGLTDKISKLQHGVETSMLKFLDDEGIELSGGESQKIAIARSLYKNAPITILDEPTSALDPIAEFAVYESFNKIAQGKTVVYISHRLASTRFCDQIAMFEDGQIVEYGTHHDLIKLNGKYSKMFNIQAQYYKEEDKDEKNKLD